MGGSLEAAQRRPAGGTPGGGQSGQLVGGLGPAGARTASFSDLIVFPVSSSASNWFGVSRSALGTTWAERRRSQAAAHWSSAGLASRGGASPGHARKRQRKEMSCGSWERGAPAPRLCRHPLAPAERTACPRPPSQGRTLRAGAASGWAAAAATRLRLPAPAGGIARQAEQADTSERRRPATCTERRRAPYTSFGLCASSLS